MKNASFVFGVLLLCLMYLFPTNPNDLQHKLVFDYVILVIGLIWWIISSFMVILFPKSSAYWVKSKSLKELFGIRPPNPEFISVHYWENGIHVWRPGNDTDKLYKSTLKPNKDKEIYIVGETFSKKQGWIEGSLETCYDVLKMVSLDGYTIVSSKSTINDKKIK